MDRANAGAHARLIRHAQASFGSADYDCLSPLGLTQARHLAQWLAADATLYTQVIRGSMRRHAQTLELIEAAFAAADRPLPAARIDPAWNEFAHEPVLHAYAVRNAGDAQIAPARAGDMEALRRLVMAAVQAWRDGALDGDVPETWPEFGWRVAAARARIGHDGGAVLIVTSGGAIWRCAQAALALDDAGLTRANLLLRNSAISDFARSAGGWRMLAWDTVPHLAAREQESLWTHY